MRLYIAIAAAFFAASAAASEPALFDIPLGSQLDEAVPLCEMEPDALWPRGTVPCRRNPKLAVRKAWGTYEDDLTLPKEHPQYLRSLSYAALDGKVVGVTAATFGDAYQAEVFALLRERFGKPSASGSSTLTNAFGVKVRALSARWKLRGATLYFEGVTTERDWETVRLETDDYTQAVRAALRRGEGGMKP